MEDELDLDLDENKNEEKERINNRIKSLSEKVKLTAQERDELKKSIDERDSKLSSIQKENDFLKGFSKVASKYSGASDYQEKIWEKVNGGYSIDDATVSTLVAEGKFTPPTEPKDTGSAAGGSASTGMTAKGEKSIKEMTLEEKREALSQVSISDILG